MHFTDASTHFRLIGMTGIATIVDSRWTSLFLDQHARRNNHATSFPFTRYVFDHDPLVVNKDRKDGPFHGTLPHHFFPLIPMFSKGRLPLGGDKRPLTEPEANS